MSTSPTAMIAVHMVTYNSEKTVAQCLESLQAQTISFDLCIIDNASCDRTRDCLNELGYSFLANSTNRGFSAAHNQALQLTQAPYVLTLNPDVRLMPDFLEKMVDSFEQNPNIGAQAGLLLRVEALDEAPHSIDSCGLTLQANHRQRLRYEGCAISDAPDCQEIIFGPDGAAAVYRREMLDAISVDKEVFDEDFFIQKEDVDICWRAAFAGWDSAYNPSACAYHIRNFRPGERDRVSGTIRWYAVRNRYLLFMKHWRMRFLLPHLPSILLYEVGILVYLIAFERSSLSSLWDAFRLSGRMLYKRKKIREKQIIPDHSMIRWFHD